VLAMPFRHWSEPTRRAVVARIPAVMRSSSTLAPWLFLAQAAVMAASGWVFGDMLTGLDSFISRPPVADFSALAPENQPRQILFALTICMQVLMFSAAWLHVARSHWHGANGETRAFMLGGAFLVAVTFFCGQIIPYRILYHNRNERVAYGTKRCYLVGTRGNDGQLFCPAQPPRNRTVKLDDPALSREGVVENIFAGLGSGTH
jgi:heme/copper-type cytochrome/quinol oxidase subunit 3